MRVLEEIKVENLFRNYIQDMKPESVSFENALVDPYLIKQLWLDFVEIEDIDLDQFGCPF